MRLINLLINAILPPRCIKCGKILSERNGLCGECFNQINFISEPFCSRCGRPFASEANLKTGRKKLCGACLQNKKPLFKMQRSAFVYDDVSKSLVIDFKFNDKTAMAESLAYMLYAAGRDIWHEEPDLLIAVPIHKIRLIKRRYNQSALLVKYLAQKTGITADYFSLIRQENTIPQAQLSRASRLKNLQHAFKVVKPENIKGKKIVIVDDVETTGSTLNECAKVLKQAGAKQIYAVTLARTEL